MNTTLIITTIIIVVAVLMTGLAMARTISRLKNEARGLQSKLEKAVRERRQSEAALAESQRQGGVGQSTVLALAGEITRMENNLNYMGNIRGERQLKKSLERMKMALRAEDYTIVPMLGLPYNEGMRATAVFVEDVSLPVGEAVIISVQKPQINRGGEMLQAASITVGQNCAPSC